MLKSIPKIAAAAVLVAFVSIATVSSAQCTTCGTGGDVTFGYPGGGCATCGAGGRHGAHRHGEVLRAKLQHAREIDAKVSARNAAWPKPFTCADRQLYSAYWRPMVQAGFADQCTVSAVHFDEDAKLNKYGQQQVAGIMKNMPSNRKVVFVQQAEDDETTQARYNEVQQVVATWYGQSGRVALTNRSVINQVGPRAEAITNSYFSNLAPPIIPVADGTSSVNSSVGSGN